LKSKIYSLLSISYLALGLTAPNFASAELSNDLGQRYENGATYDGISCPNGMCDDYSDSPQDPSWPASHKTQEEIIYVEEEVVEQEQTETEIIEEEEEEEIVEYPPKEIEEETEQETLAEPATAPKSRENKYYMRFDIGMGIKDSEAKFKPSECGNGTTLACDPLTDEKGTFVEGSYGGALSKGIGLGVNINSFLRFDATLSQRADFSFDEDLTKRGTTAHFDTSASDDGVNPDLLYDKEMQVENNIQNLTAMASLYVDFFRRYSTNEQGRVSRSAISPYIGAGIGYAKNTIEDMTGDFIAYYRDISDPSLPPFDLDGLWRLQGASNTGLAWKFTGGLNFAISERTWLDISYSYLNLGTVKTANRYTITMDTDINNNGISGDIGDADIDGNAGADPGYLEYDNAGSQEFELELHEVAIGLRYEF